MALQITHRRYKKNVAIDMVAACLKHYKQFNRPVEEIQLSNRLWGVFRDGILELKPELQADIDHHNEVSFKNCKVKKASVFMIKDMHVELKVLTIDRKVNGN